MSTRLITASLSLATLLLGVNAFGTYELNYYSEDTGNQCGGTSLRTDDGPDQVGLESQCFIIPDGAQTFRIAVQDDKVNHLFRTYSDQACGGDELGADHPTHNSPECLPLHGAGSLGVVTLPCGNEMNQCDKKKRESRDLAPLTLENDEGSNSTDLLKRVNAGRYDIAFAKVIAGGTFVYMAAGVCPATAKDEDVNVAQCAISSVLSVITLFFGGFEAYGIFTKGGPDSRRSLPEALGGHVSRASLMTERRPGLPYKADHLVPGASITFTPIEKYFDADGKEWDHWDFEGHHHALNHTSRAKLRVHQPTGRSVAYSPVEEDTDLGKRASGITAYYSWTNNNDQIYTTGDSSSDAVADYAVQMWNYLHSNNIDAACANFELNGERLNQGDIAIEAGTYTDQSGRC